MASICSTAQSPRATKAFSSAWAARTWPAPEDAERRRTRGLRVMRRGEADGKTAARRISSCGLPCAGGKFFQNAASNLLRFAKARQIFLKFVVDVLGFLHAELVAQDHVAKFDRVRKERVFLQLFKGGCRIVVVHGTSGTVVKAIVLVRRER